MQPTRLSRDHRRQQILEHALPLFARHGFAGTTTRRIADAAGVSEALLFKHFPTKSAIYAAILADICTADPGLERLRAEPPSTQTLALIVRGMAHYFLATADGSEAEGNQKLRLTLSSFLEDGEFAKVLFDKVEQVIAPIFIDSLEQAIAVGDAYPGRRQFAPSLLVRPSYDVHLGGDAISIFAIARLSASRQGRTRGLRLYPAWRRPYRCRDREARSARRSV